MKIATNYGWVAGLLMMVCCGCSTTGELVPRGQGPELQAAYQRGAGGQIHQRQIRRTGHSSNLQPGHGYFRHTAQEIHGAKQNYHNGFNHTWHSSPVQYSDTYAAPQGGVCPQCETGQCQPGHPGCMKIRHHHTYDVKRMRNSVYPAAGQPGGAVVYPYYTHKGPSDFFWKGD